MRLFHVSEEAGIEVFHPRPPKRPDLPAALFARGFALRVLDSFWDLCDAVRVSTLAWFLCRMANAQMR